MLPNRAKGPSNTVEDIERVTSVWDLHLMKAKTVVDGDTFTKEGVVGLVPPREIGGVGVLGWFYGPVEHIRSGYGGHMRGSSRGTGFA